MLKLFYDTVQEFYNKRWPQHDPWFYAWMATVLMLAFNCLSFYFAAVYFIKIGYSPEIVLTFIALSVLLFLYLYLSGINEESTISIFRYMFKHRNYIALLYIVFTISSMIVLVNLNRSLLSQ